MRVACMVLEDGRGGEAVDGSSEVGWEGMGGVSGRGFRSATASRAGGSISRRDVDRSDGGSLWSDFSILAAAVGLSSSLVVVREKRGRRWGWVLLQSCFWFVCKKAIARVAGEGRSMIVVGVVLRRKRSDGVGWLQRRMPSFTQGWCRWTHLSSTSRWLRK